MTQTPGTVDVKLVVDTAEAREKIAALRKEAQAATLHPEALAGYRLRALELAISSHRDTQWPVPDAKSVLDRAAKFAQFITGEGTGHE